jgi:N-acetylglucosaminyl-diphospho-decaprenol L-rhamnosyltransferase
MRFSVIIVNYGTGGMTSACVASYKQALEGSDYEIVVVDNASRDDSVATIRLGHPDVTVIAADSNLGYGRAVNLGAKAASGDYLVISNSDILAKDRFAEDLARLYEKAGAGVVGIKLVKDDGRVQETFGHFPTPLTVVTSEISPLNRIRRRRFDSYPALTTPGAPALRVDWVTGALMFMSRKNFETLRGFDEALFMYYEDVDLCKRASALGLATYYLAGHSALHAHCASSAALPRAAYNLYKVEQRRSALTYLEKHHPGRVRAAALSLAVIFRLTLAGLTLKWRCLSFSPGRREKNRYKVETYRKLVEVARAAL